MSKSGAVITIISGLLLAGASAGSASSAATEPVSVDRVEISRAEASGQSALALRCPGRAWHRPVACAW